MYGVLGMIYGFFGVSVLDGFCYDSCVMLGLSWKVCCFVFLVMEMLGWEVVEVVVLCWVGV